MTGFPGGPRGAFLSLALAAVIVVHAPPARAVERTIEKIEVRGLRRMTVDAFLFASGLKAGQPYDENEIRRAFRRLWDRGLFSDLRAEAEEGEKGMIVIFTASERPVIASLDYDQVRAITRSNIEDRFRERNVDLSVGRPLDRKLVKRAQETIRDLLGEKGYLDATVRAEITPVSESSTSVRFRIRQGARTRIRKIDFVGNEVFSDRRLRKAMKLTKERGLFTGIGSKDIYFPVKYDQDIERVRELYQNAGYLDVDIKPPQVEIRDTKRPPRQKKRKAAEPEGEEAGEGLEEAENEAPSPAAPSGGQEPPAAAGEEPGPAAGPPEGESERQRRRRERREEKEARKAKEREEKADRKERKWVFLTVRVREGPQYRIGELGTSGNTVLTDQEIQTVFRRLGFRRGQIFDRSLLDAGVEVVRARYGEKGYIYASVGRSVEKREGNVADVTIEIREDQAYSVDRIEFEGNTTTRDEVLRREMRLAEGELLNKRKLDLSVFKLNQLGFNVPIEEPIIEPVPGTNRARIRIRTEERGRNEIQVGGGFSGQEGFFFAGSYQTRNFLGRGEDLGVSLQVGGRSSRYILSFTEPYFLGRPVALGFRIFRQDIEFAQRATRTGNGGSIAVSRQIGDFGRLAAVYSFESVQFTDRNISVTGTPFFSRTDTSTGSITPSFSYNRINNPFRPTRGFSAAISTTVAGRYLAGDNDFYRPLLQGTQYVPVTKRTYLGFHAEAGLVAAYGAGATFGGQILGIPRFERFFLGGDILGPRTFETRSISPIRFISRDGQAIARKRSEIVRFKGRDAFGQRIEKCLRPEFDHTLDRVIDPQTGFETREFAICSNGLQRVLIGGDRYLLVQSEYNIPAGDSPFVFAFFLDAANVLAEDEGFNFDSLRISAGIETRIYLPVFQAPLRFIYGVPIREEPFDSTNRFQFSIGSSF